MYRETDKKTAEELFRANLEYHVDLPQDEKSLLCVEREKMGQEPSLLQENRVQWKEGTGHWEEGESGLREEKGRPEEREAGLRGEKGRPEEREAGLQEEIGQSGEKRIGFQDETDHPEEEKQSLREETGQLEERKRSLQEEIDRLEERKRSLQEEITEKEKKRAEIAEKTNELREALRKEYVSEDWEQDESRRRKEAAAYYRDRDQIRTHVTDLQGQMYQTLNDLRDQITLAMNTGNEAICRDLEAWRGSLYKQNFESLASLYQKFYPIARRVQEEMRRGASLNESETLAQQTARYARNIATIIRQLEICFSGLGLVIYEPRPGEIFQEGIHETEYGEETPENARIDHCMTPGIRLGNAGEGEAVVLCRAVVRIIEKSPSESGSRDAGLQDDFPH